MEGTVQRQSDESNDGDDMDDSDDVANCRNNSMIIAMTRSTLLSKEETLLKGKPPAKEQDKYVLIATTRVVMRTTKTSTV